MTLIKLGPPHSESVKRLIESSADIPPDVNVNISISPQEFCEIYLTDLNSFHAYGIQNGDDITAMIAFYESTVEPAWFYTYCYATDLSVLDEVLDAVIKHNENRYRMTFYNKVITPGIRGPHWSEAADQRYLFVDDYMVPSKTLCFYYHTIALFDQKMLDPDIIVRCNILKQEYRGVVPLGGNL